MFMAGAHELGFLRAMLCIATGIAILALCEPICTLQDRIVDWKIRRARGADGNTRNPAARLAAEVQLQIFHLLRTRAAFGSRERLPCDRGFSRDFRFSPGSRDLITARLVCVAWRAAATEALFYSVVIRSALDAQPFLHTITQHPELARLVRRIVFPEAHSRTESSSQTRLSLAVDQIASLCTGATDIALFYDEAMLERVSGLSTVGMNLLRVELHGGRPDSLWNRDADTPDELDIVSLLSILPNLVDLTLTRHRVILDTLVLQPPQQRVLGRLHTLRLGTCTTSAPLLLSLLKFLPNLRVLELRDPLFSDAGPVISFSDLLRVQHSALLDLALLFNGTRTRIAFGNLGAFGAVRTLTVNAHMLAAIRVLPPVLTELIVSFAPYSSQEYPLHGSEYRKILIAAVGDVSALAPTTPTLRSVQLWDEIRLYQMPCWHVAGFMLHERLAPAGVALAINLL
ncbi:hypothetical protein AURDEDRAFT_166688 [Auricularia subglabra TFB-10046 SS5]|nr:hypothetical protein AURDEDRAFT_166688 [Auricularia subglabra TFB-10046 SS5]